MSIGAIERPTRSFPKAPRPPFIETGALRLFLRGDSFFANFRDSLAALASRGVAESTPLAKYFLRGSSVTKTHISGRPLSASILLHGSLLALLIYLPRILPAAAPPLVPGPSHELKIYYRVPVIDAQKLARLLPSGPGGRSGSGSQPSQAPALGSSSVMPRIIIVSRPVHPDSRRQTIYQPASPPELKIPTDLKLPNIVMLHALARPKAPLIPSDARPSMARRHESATAAPSISMNPSATNPLVPVNSDPQLHPPIPLVGGSGAPILRGKASSGSVAGSSASDAMELVVVGLDPADSTGQLSLPGGNRWGEFSIAPPTGTSGSPGGVASGTVGGGSGGAALGGDSSGGVGSGHNGGGGGNLGASIPVSIIGPGSGEPAGGALDPALAMNMVFAVAPSAISIRKNSLIVSAGPIGGGGLNVYGALKCGRIYSIFLPMPRKNWSLQYCDKSASAQKVAAAGGTTTLRLDSPLVPPDFDPIHRFDFKRIPVPVENSHRSIILKGEIGVDGTVQHLVVYQGVAAQMDEAAKIAFGRWRFKPAMKEGKPVEVEILVGIPPLSEDDHVNR